MIPLQFRQPALIAFVVVAMVLGGCARTPHGQSSLPYLTSPHLMMPTTGIYHRVEKGETLWRIAQQYQVGVDVIMQANKLPERATIEAGQRLYIPGKPTSLALPPHVKPIFLWPVQGNIIAPFGAKRLDVTNKGIDIQTKEGTAIRAAQSGRVSFVGEQVKGFGKVIILDHEHGFQSVYAHNAQNLVKVNDVVKQRGIIAKVGSTGRAAVPSLHFEIRRNYKPINPLEYLPS